MSPDPAFVYGLRRHMLSLHPDAWEAGWTYHAHGLQNRPALVCDECGRAEPLPEGQDGPFLAKAVMQVSVGWEKITYRTDEEGGYVHNNPPWYEVHDIIRRAGEKRDRDYVETLPTWRLRAGDRLLGDLEVVHIAWALDALPIVPPFQTAYDHVLEEP